MGLVQSHNSFIRAFKKFYLHVFFIVLILYSIGFYSHSSFLNSKNESIRIKIIKNKNSTDANQAELQRLSDVKKTLSKQIEEFQNTQFTIPEEQIRKINEFVESQNGSTKRDLPKIRFITRHEFEKEFRDEVDKNRPSIDALENFKIFLQTFNFIDKSISKDQFLNELVKSQVNFPSAFYDLGNGQLTLIKGLSSSQVYYNFNLAHELNHYSQDKDFNLKDRTEYFKNISTDQYFSFLAVAEGQAQLTSQKYVNTLDNDSKIELNKAISKITTSTGPSKISLFDESKGNFVYGKGLDFVEEINDTQVINSILKEGNITSRQILHPEELNKKLNTQNIDFNFINESYKFSDSDVLGEIGCRMINRGQQDFESACSGWKSDKYKLYKKNDNNIISMIISWDNEEKARIGLTEFNNSLSSYGLNFSTKVSGNTLFILIASDPSLKTVEELAKIQISD